MTEPPEPGAQPPEPARRSPEPGAQPLEPARRSPEPVGQPPEPASRSRDRDAAGRPRNARPRDGLGRPLSRTAAGEASPIPDDLAVTPAEAAALGGSLLAQDRPFHAHEVFEAAWKSSSGPDRELWRGLAQIAVGLTHARRGNARGAVALLRRGARQVGDYPGDPRSYGVDPQFVAASAADVAARIERDGLPDVPPDALRLALHPAPA